MPLPLRLWLVEDEPAYSTSFERLVGASDEFVLDASFDCFEDVPRRPARRPDLVVMDLQLPGLGGIEATRRLRGRHPGIRVVVLTLVDTADAVFEALRAGASGYVVKGTRPAEIFRSLREAHAGGTYFSPSVARHVLRFFAPPAESALSAREREVLTALSRGLSKAKIADLLFLSPHTVDTHVRNVYDKLEVRTAAEAVAKGVRAGLI